VLARKGTYDCRVYKGCPALAVFEERKHKRDSGRAEQDDDELVLELLEDELPDGRWRVFWQRCGSLASAIVRHIHVSSNIPFLPCFSRRVLTCCSERPLSSATWKCWSASAGVLVYAFSMPPSMYSSEKLACRSVARSAGMCVRNNHRNSGLEECRGEDVVIKVRPERKEPNVVTKESKDCDCADGKVGGDGQMLHAMLQLRRNTRLHGLRSRFVGAVFWPG
jgi:hypothetical protein